MSIYELKEGDNFEEIINSHENVIVDMYADWCGPCAEILKKIKEEYIDKGVTNFKLVKLNVDDNQELADSFETPGIPYTFFYKNGQKKLEFYGKQWDKLEQIMNETKN
jgi:thioredoxin 1